MLKKVLVIVLFLFFTIVKGQELTHAKVQLKANVLKDNSVGLRWAVDEPIAWWKATKLSFVLKRYTVLRDKKMLIRPEEVVLGQFKVAPVEKWKQAIETNNYIAIVAQAIFGESFEVQMSKNGNQIEQIANKSRELEQRFAYALMAADLDFEAAKLAGWGYVDTTVKKNEKYLYRITVNTQNNPSLKIDKGIASVALYEKQVLPAPQDFAGLFRDRTVLLSWDYRFIKKYYSSFYVERSDNQGRTFKKLGDLPIVDMNSKANKSATSVTFVDSLPQNNKEYVYRVRGKTFFNEYGPYSKIMKGKGKKELKIGAQITFSDIAKDESILLKWKIDQVNHAEIKHFALLHSETDKEGSYKIVKNYIPSTQRQIVTKSLASSNYFKIRTIGFSEDFNDSFSVLLQPNDETPPAIPIDVKGRIDSLGIAHLSWKKNTEKDLMGYHVFRATKKAEEFVRITDIAIKTPFYKDTVQLKSLTTEVFYRIASIDKRYNQSKFSKLLTLKKPDVLIPQSPVFTDYKQEDGTIRLNFKRSFSKDVALHQLYRIKLSELNTNEWEKVFETTKIKDTYSFVDKKLEPNQQYRYYLQAVDKSGLKSNPSQNLTLTAIDLRPLKPIKKLKIKRLEKSVVLSWELLVKNASEILIYRAKNNEIPTLWKTLQGNATSTKDLKVKEGVKYTYTIKVMLQNNKLTQTVKKTI